MIVTPLYHWSPHERFYSILQNGLIPFAAPRIPIENEELKTIVTGWPYVCLGTSPTIAWKLSGDMNQQTEIERWDLWEVSLHTGDEVHIRAEWGPHIREIRVNNTISPDRVIYVASREPRTAREEPIEGR